ncbi:zinc-binding dehydrogenase [Nocardia sp. NPDC059236]|uniref:zinc-binding dehydrogenase n=1 Tax=Nocardia sp. NPDC059236 TaxID=3346783 RepID=UPI0036B56259
MLVQSARAAGAVIGAVSGEKVPAAADFGAHTVVDYTVADWPERVRELTGGRGADVVLDAVGGAVGEAALTVAADGGGRIGLYGFASGAWPRLDALTLGTRGLTVSGPLRIVFRRSDAEQRGDAEWALAAAGRGELRPRIHARHPLGRAADAHRELEERRNVGAILLSVRP